MSTAIKDLAEKFVKRYSFSFGVEEKNRHIDCFMAGYDEAIKEIQQMVDAQAEDEGLWFDAKTAPEGYLQQELRKLHAVIENKVSRENT